MSRPSFATDPGEPFASPGSVPFGTVSSLVDEVRAVLASAPEFSKRSAEPVGAAEAAGAAEAVAAVDAVDGWRLIVPEPSEDRLRLVESLLTVADGVVGTRGSLEEDGPSALPATLVAGAYEDRQDAAQGLMTLPSWIGVELASGLRPGERCLDLRTGILWRIVRAQDGRILLRSARWASLADPGTGVLVLEAAPEVLDAARLEPAPVHIERSSALGSRVHGVVETHWERLIPASPVESERLEVARMASFSSDGRAGPAPTGNDRSRRPTQEDLAEVTRLHRRPRCLSALLTEQAGAWATQWSGADVEVVGDHELTLAVRHALFQLIGATADRGEAAVGARGLTGPAYAGHVFWDADVFVLPVMAAIRPRAARAMLEYRIRRLDAARRAAAAFGRQGARFPWESAFDGVDVTPDHGVDEHGTVVPIRTGQLEEHITADVAWAAWHFASVTGSWALLEGRGRGLLVDTARYWASRIRVDDGGRGHIDGVIGPDEYHEHVDDNAFTNTMAAWNLRRAVELVHRTLGSAGPAVDAEREEALRWSQLADALITGYDRTSGRHHQFAGFDDLEPLVAADVGTVPMPADLVLGRERLMRSQIIKQADVLMLHHLVPDAVPASSRETDIDYYLPRTAHGSSLSPSIHAAVLARAGRLDEAANLLDLGRRVDLEDLTGTAAGGLHVAAMGGLWQALVFGFAGIASHGPGDDVLFIDPLLPDHWQEVRIRMLWHGLRVRLCCRNQAVFVGCSDPVSVVVGNGRSVTVDPPGRWVDVDRTGGAP